MSKLKRLKRKSQWEWWELITVKIFVDMDSFSPFSYPKNSWSVPKNFCTGVVLICDSYRLILFEIINKF